MIRKGTHITCIEADFNPSLINIQGKVVNIINHFYDYGCAAYEVIPDSRFKYLGYEILKFKKHEIIRTKAT